MAGPTGRSTVPSAFWGVIQAGAAAGDTTAELFERITAEAERLQVPLPSGGAIAFNELRSMATRLRIASENLAAAPASNAITSAYLSELPYGNIGGAGAGPRIFDVRVNYTGVSAAGEVSDYITLRYTGGLPATVGDLRAEAADIASALVEGYGTALTAIGTIQIGEL